MEERRERLERSRIGGKEKEDRKKAEKRKKRGEKRTGGNGGKERNVGEK